MPTKEELLKAAATIADGGSSENVKTAIAVLSPVVAEVAAVLPHDSFGAYRQVWSDVRQDALSLICEKLPCMRIDPNTRMRIDPNKSVRGLIYCILKNHGSTIIRKAEAEKRAQRTRALRDKERATVEDQLTLSIIREAGRAIASMTADSIVRHFNGNVKKAIATLSLHGVWYCVSAKAKCDMANSVGAERDLLPDGFESMRKKERNATMAVILGVTVGNLYVLVHRGWKLLESLSENNGGETPT